MDLGVYRKRAMTALLSFVVLAGSTRTTERAAVVTNKERALIINEVEWLQKAVDEGFCVTIYEKAAAEFKQSEPRQNWWKKCELIGRTWGDWKPFRANSWERVGSNIMVEGAAAFSRSDSVQQLVWALRPEGHSCAGFPSRLDSQRHVS